MKAIVQLLVFVALAGPWHVALAELETRRWPLETVFPDRPGSFFRIYDDAVKRDPALSFEASAVEAIGGIDNAKRVVDYLRHATPDDLARTFMASHSALQATSFGIHVIASMYRSSSGGRQLFEEAVGRTRNEAMGLPGGGSVKVSMVAASEISRFIFNSSAPALHGLTRHAAIGPVAGGYELTTSGKCPIESGRFDLVRHESLVEGVRNGVPMLIGAVGDSEAYFLLPEKTWATTVADREQRGKIMEIRVPDEPASFFRAQLGLPELVLRDTIKGHCSVSLRKLDSGIDAAR